MTKKQCLSFQCFLIPLFQIPFVPCLLLSTLHSHLPLLLPFSSLRFNFSTLFNSPSLQPLAFHHSLQCSFTKKSRGSRGDAVSLCKCHFVSSEGGERKQKGKVRVEEFMSRDATPSFALSGWEKRRRSIGNRERERKRQRGLMVSDVLGDSSKICLPAA